MARPNNGSQVCKPRCQIQPKSHAVLLIVQIHKRPPKSKGNRLPSKKITATTTNPCVQLGTKGRKQPKRRFKVAMGGVWGRLLQPGGPAHLRGGRQGQGPPAALQQHRPTHRPADALQPGRAGVVAIPPSQAAQPAGLAQQEQVTPASPGKLPTGQVEIVPQDRKKRFKESYPGVLVGSSGSCRGEKHR